MTEMIFRSFGRSDSEVGVKCCDKLMLIKDLPSESYNDNPIELKCTVCGKKLKGNQSFFESPKIHTEWRITI